MIKMGLLGFPTAKDLSEMMGYVTPEDRAKWDQQKEASDKVMDRSRSGLTAKQLASQASSPALGMAEKSITAQINAEQHAIRERQHKTGEEEVEVTERRIRRSFVPREDAPRPSPSGGPEMGF